jgi:Na+/H+ antiporter NhaD/arsenite permease-like protein
VDFFWTLRHLWPPTLFLVSALLLLFYLIDRHWYRREGVLPVDPTPDSQRLGLDGAINLLPLGAIVALVLLSGMWQPGIRFDILGTSIELQSLVRDGLLLVVTGISLAITPAKVRQANQFSWGPMQEVAKLFIGIFITMMPVLAMLKAGEAGAFAPVARAVTGEGGQPLPWAYFWFSGGLSSFLDNAPTYLVFFNLAGGDPQQLMGPLATTLVAVSAGSVFMGANSYIGNAPNFMVKAVVEDRGITMPSFFGYMAWSGAVLIPLFLVITWLWMR